MKQFTLKKIALISSIALLTGCGGSSQDVSLDPVAPTAEQLKASSGVVVMDFANSNIPFPHDALFSGTEDGTLNIPVSNAADISDPTVALNAVDGFSTSAPISFSVTKPLDSADNNANTLADIFETGLAVYQATTTLVDGANVVTAVDAALVPGVDYFPQIVGGTTVAIVPLKPLNPATTYVVVAKKSLLDTDGNELARSANYVALSGSEELSGSLERLEPLRKLTNAHLSALETYGENLSNIVGSWTFTTQSIGAVLNSLASNLTATNITMLDTDESTAPTTDVFNAALSGDAKVFRGEISLPYYLSIPSVENPTAPINTFWLGAQGSLVSQYNPTPVKTLDVNAPVILTTPLNWEDKPASGWPVVIFQHGITASRTNVLAIADALASQGYAAIAIDMPLHGLTENGYFNNDGSFVERTLGIDYVTQDGTGSITAAEPDGIADSSGRHFINLSSLLTTRDNLRQAVVDLLQLKASLGNVTGLGDNVLDTTNVSFIGHSLGAMVGAAFANYASDLQTGIFANGGTQAAYLLAGSPAFGPEISAGLAAQGVAPGSADFSRFLVAAQTVIDTVDPVNHVASIAIPSALFEVVGDGSTGSSDQVVPNNVAGAPLAGTDPWRALQALPTVTAAGAVSQKAALLFNAGGHSSLLDPSASLLVTQTMQEAAVSFTATLGSQILISDDTTLVSSVP